MREKKQGDVLKRLLKKVNNTPNWVAVLAFATTLVFCPLSFFVLVLDDAHRVYAIVACLISGFVFVYTALVTVNSIIKLRRKVLNVADRYEFTRNMYKNYEFRTIVFNVCAFVFNVGYTIVLVVMAFTYRSVWYGALAVYYILLAMTRGGVLVQNRKDERTYAGDFLKLQKAKVGTYRYCGIMILALALALAVSVVEVSLNGMGSRLAKGWIYVFAAFALYRVANGIVQFVRSTKRNDLVVRAVRYLNLAVTLVSVLSLQTAIVGAFSVPFDAAVVNAVTGSVVCLSTVALGAFMIAFSGRERKRLSAQEIWETEREEALTDGYNRDGYREEYGVQPEEQNERKETEKDIL